MDSLRMLLLLRVTEAAVSVPTPPRPGAGTPKEPAVTLPTLPAPLSMAPLLTVTLPVDNSPPLTAKVPR